MQQKKTTSSDKPHDSQDDLQEVWQGQLTSSGDGEPKMRRNFNFLRILALGYSVSNSWLAIATSLPLAISAGGTVTLLYGIIVVAFTMGCTGLSMAELGNVYPTVGGQYHFTSILAPSKHSRWLSYTCGWIGVCSWIAIAASVAFVTTQCILAMAIHLNPSFEPKPWHYFLVYLAVQLMTVGYNVLIDKTLWIYTCCFCLSLATYLVISIVCPVRAPSRLDTLSIWTDFVNSSGEWPDGVSFLTGLSTPAFMLIGLDATLHLADECHQPARIIPRAIIATVAVGFVTSFTFAVALCYSLTEVESLLNTPTNFPVYILWEQASRSTACATIFMVALLCVAVIALTAMHQTASRLTWSFACDEALIFSGYFKRIHPKLKVPLNALLLNFTACFLIGILYLVSTSAFNAFIGTSIILSTISIAIPIALLLFQRRSSEYLPAARTFRLPSIVGFFCNFIAVAWSLIVTIFFCLPTTFPVTASNMNYACAVLGIILILAALNWGVSARKRYQGPRLDFL